MGRVLRVRGLAVATVVGMAAGLLAGTAAAAPTSPTKPAKARVPQGINPSNLRGAKVFGPTPPNTPETVSFVLRERDLPELALSVEQGATHDLSVSQFAAAYGQRPAVVAQLRTYLAGYGITTQAYPDRVDVVASGTAGQFDRALSVQQHQYRVPAHRGRDGMAGVRAQTIHGTTQSPQLPYDVGRSVLAILGLTNYGPFASQAAHVDRNLHVQGSSRSAAGATNCVALTGLASACHTPADFAHNYGLDGLYHQGANGAGQTVAIVTLAAMDSGAPQHFWRKVVHVPATGRTVKVVNVDGGPGAPSDNAGSSETDLDVEQSGGVAPGANVVVYQAPNTDYGFADAFFEAASTDTASTVSASWGESETAVEASVASGQESLMYEAAFDEAFLEMAAQGQSGFLSSGDEGAYTASGDIGTTNLSADVSADSPFITAAGGTTLPWSATFSGPGGTAEVKVAAQRAWGWDYLWKAIAKVTGSPLATAAESEVAGSGGGFSGFEPVPTYQLGVPGTRTYSAVEYLTPTDYKKVDHLVEPTAWSFDPTPAVTHGADWGRALPDVSADADPYSGYLLYSPAFAQSGNPVLEGGWGGTSFVAPELNGATAVIDSYLGHRVGFWNPAIYRFAGGGSSPFTPLDRSGTGNDNLYYTGTPGTLYNQATGLGYPNLTALAEDFASGGSPLPHR